MPGAGAPICATGCVMAPLHGINLNGLSAACRKALTEARFFYTLSYNAL